MSKKTKDNTIELFYVEDNENKVKKKNKRKNDSISKIQQPKKDIINLDDEIIIGLTPKPNKKQRNAVNANQSTKGKGASNKRNVAGRNKPTHKRQNIK